MSGPRAHRSVYRSDDDEVVRLGRAVVRRDRLQHERTALKIEIQATRARLVDLEAAGSARVRDVERLEAHGVSWVLWSVVGRAKAKLHEGREEALDTERRVAEKRRERDGQDAKLSRLEEELRELEGVDETYQRAFDQKVRSSIGAGAASGTVLQGFLDELLSLKTKVLVNDNAYLRACRDELALASVLRTITSCDDKRAAAMMFITTRIAMMSLETGGPTDVGGGLEPGRHVGYERLPQLLEFPLPPDSGWDEKFLSMFSKPTRDRSRWRSAQESEAHLRSALAAARSEAAELKTVRSELETRYRHAMRCYRLAGERS